MYDVGVVKPSAKTNARIRRLRGILQPRPGEKSLPRMLLADRAWEKQHDEAKWAKLGAGADSDKHRSR
jgi:hypothetical protein